MAASEARRCFHKREDTRKTRERERYLRFTNISRYRVVYPCTTFVKSNADVTNWSWNRHGRTSGAEAMESVKIRECRDEGEGSLWNGVVREFQEFTARSELSINYTFRSIFSAYRTRTEPHVDYSYSFPIENYVERGTANHSIGRLFVFLDWTRWIGFNCQVRWDTKMSLFAKPL